MSETSGEVLSPESPTNKLIIYQPAGVSVTTPSPPAGFSIIASSPLWFGECPVRIGEPGRASHHSIIPQQFTL